MGGRYTLLSRVSSSLSYYRGLIVVMHPLTPSLNGGETSTRFKLRDEVYYNLSDSHRLCIVWSPRDDVLVMRIQQGSLKVPGTKLLVTLPQRQL
jgi:hypothetical protein